jgi:uncharacterized protein YegP (UPF0339 family)
VNETADIPRRTETTRELAFTNNPYFEIYQAGRVRLTSILFSGEDWRWRFCSQAGRTLASGGGYGTERECIEAVEALRAGSPDASIRGIATPGRK